MKKKYTTICISVLIGALFLCGYDWFVPEPEITLDTESRIVYECYSADSILRDYSVDTDMAKERYDKHYVRVLGTIAEKTKNNKSIKLSSIKAYGNRTIECSASNEDVIADITELEANNRVNVYGKFNISITGTLEISVDKIVTADSDEIHNNMYALAEDDYEIDKTKLYKRTLSDEKVTYYIPAGWKEVEQNIVEKEIGAIEGYQYNLNCIVDSDDAEVIPECLFVTYFKNDKYLKRTNERGKTTEIEKAIINNILGGVEKFPTKKVTTYYGASYQYYQDIFKDDNSQSYRIEIVFQPVEHDGIIVFIYLYKDNDHMKHINDVMSVLRFTEAK